METSTTAVGIDLGDRFSHWCALNKAGDITGRDRVRTSAEAIAEQAAAWRGARVAIENGTHSEWVSRALCRALVAVARKLAVLLHRLWVTGERFHPFPNAVPEETVDAEMRAHRSLRTAAARTPKGGFCKNVTVTVT